MNHVFKNRFAAIGLFIGSNLGTVFFLWLCIALGVGLSPYSSALIRPLRLELGLVLALFPAVALVAVAALPSLKQKLRYGYTISRILSVVFCTVSWSLMVLDGLISYFAGGRINEAVLRIILQSNPKEAGEFLAHLPVAETFGTLIPWMLLPFTGLAVGIGISHIYAKIKGRLRFFISAAAISAATLSGLAFFYFEYRGIADTTLMLSGRITPLQFYIAYQNLEDTSVHIANLSEVLNRTTACSDDSTATTVVVVIGESDNKWHSSLYGYRLNTWSRLDSIQRNKTEHNGILVPFADAVTGDGWTMVAMPHLLTTRSDSTLWSKCALWPALVRKAQLHMEYYDNQSVQHTTSSSDHSCLFFINDTELSGQCFDYRNDTIFSYDGNLLDRYLPRATASPAHSVLLFHFIGQHIHPEGRYPAEKAVFTAENYDFRPELSASEKGELAHYDNATAYLDENLARIISAFDSRDAVIIYTPDHGEPAYDYGHKFQREVGVATPEYVRSVHSIPFVVYMTRAFVDAHPTKADALIANSKKRVQSYDLGHLVLDLAGIQTTVWQPGRSVASLDYSEPETRRIIDGSCNYDSIIASVPE